MAEDELMEEQLDTTVPEMWKLANPENPDPESGKPGPGPKVGRLVKYLNDIEEPEEFEQKIAERDPATGQSLLMWATLSNRFVLVEWLIKKGKRNAFALNNDKKEITVFDKWVEMRKEALEKEKERLANPPEEAEEEEDKQPEPTLEQIVFEALGDYHEEWGNRANCIVKSVGELGVYHGARDEEMNKCGLGQSLYPNGDMYVGEYSDNQRNGTGTYWFEAEGLIYNGQWKHNVRSGIGRMVYADGGRYYGSWVNNKRHGNGRYTYPDGSSYSGDWVDDVKEGQGTMAFNDGSFCIGCFVNGDFISGEWRLAGGTRYYGTFKDYRPNGKGMFVFKVGREGSYRQEGAYVDGVWQPGDVTTSQSVPEVEVLVQGTTTKLSYTEECAAAGVEVLLQIVNFGPFREWLANLEKNNTVFVESVAVSAVKIGAAKNIESVQLKVAAVDANGKRILGASKVLLQEPSTRLLVILACGDELTAIVQSSPQPSQASADFISLPQVGVSATGNLTGNFVSLARASLGVELSTKTTMPLSTGGAPSQLYTDAGLSNSTTRTLVYVQAVHPDLLATLDTRLMDVNGPGNFTKLRNIKVQDLLTTSTDALTVFAAASVLEAQRRERLPKETVEPQRPPTPIPPAPEQRPDIQPLLEAERQAAKAAENAAAEE